jgi:hypothetical protein
VWSILEEMTGDEHNPLIADFQVARLCRVWPHARCNARASQTAQFFQEEQDDTQTQVRPLFSPLVSHRRSAVASVTATPASITVAVLSSSASSG